MSEDNTQTQGTADQVQTQPAAVDEKIEVEGPGGADAAAAEVWSAEGMSQEDFMLKDQCILLDMNDRVIGCDNKYETHIFCPQRPRAKLHRAFSVFLFNDKNELLLQQRAAAKITFPNVWTNTCCSHPLSGYGGVEVDGPEDVSNGRPTGVMRAAVRKFLHELGVPAEQLPISKFKFLTRLHYWAADVVTHGPDSPFGEHEIDYILFIQTPVTCDLNPEEVSAVQYVSQEKLRELMKPESGLLWSPWFRIIAERFLPKWWADLNKTLTTDELTDFGTIHRFDCSQEHLGGHGGAGTWLNSANPTPDGDGWLRVVKENGGKPPRTTPLKPLLVKVSEGSGGGVYKLNDGLESARTAPNALVFTVSEVADASKLDAFLSTPDGCLSAAQNAAGFVSTLRNVDDNSHSYTVSIVFENGEALAAFGDSNADFDNEVKAALLNANGGSGTVDSTTEAQR